MGNAYQIECGGCNYSTQVYVGGARNDLDILTRSFAEIQHGAAGRDARLFLRMHQQTYITIERRLYECPACGRIQPRITACLHSDTKVFSPRYFCEVCNAVLAQISPKALAGRPCPKCGKPLSVGEPVPFDIIPAVGEVRPSPMQHNDNSLISLDCLAPIPISKGAKEMRYWIASRDNMPIGVNRDGQPLFERYFDPDAAATDPDAYIVVRGGPGEAYDSTLLTCPFSEASVSASDVPVITEGLRTLIQPYHDTFGDRPEIIFLHGGPDIYISSSSDIDAPLLSTLWLHPLLDDHFELIALLLKLQQNRRNP